MTDEQPNREMYGKTLVELGERDSRIIVFEADIAKSTNTWRFRDRFPERFFQAGTAELNMVCMAAGAATTGLIPFCSTFVVFASMRACEGVRTSIAYPKLNVKIVATNAGVEIAGRRRDTPGHRRPGDPARHAEHDRAGAFRSRNDPRKATLAIAGGTALLHAPGAADAPCALPGRRAIRDRQGDSAASGR